MVRSLAALCLLALLAAPSCRTHEDTPPDDAPARRIVSLAPPFTEMLFALGRGDRLVARSSYCDAPSGAGSLPIAGDAQQVRFETLIALEPDLVITHSRALEGLLRPHRESLRVRYIPCDSIEDVVAAILTLGHIAEAEAEAARMAATIRATVRAARATVDDGPRPTVLYVADRDPFHAAAGGSYVGSLLELAGGTNIVGDLTSAYPALSLETIIARRPDVIIDGTPTGDEGDAAAWRYWSRFPDLPAVRDRRVHGLPHDAVIRPGPRLPDALRALRALLRPESGR